jgi:hypothetical protein
VTAVACRPTKAWLCTKDKLIERTLPIAVHVASWCQKEIELAPAGCELRVLDALDLLNATWWLPVDRQFAAVT